MPFLMPHIVQCRQRGRWVSERGSAQYVALTQVLLPFLLSWPTREIVVGLRRSRVLRLLAEISHCWKLNCIWSCRCQFSSSHCCCCCCCAVVCLSAASRARKEKFFLVCGCHCQFMALSLSLLSLFPSLWGFGLFALKSKMRRQPGNTAVRQRERERERGEERQRELPGAHNNAANFPPTPQCP